MKRLTLAIGLIISLYGLISLGVFTGLFFISSDRWWNIAVFRESGYWLVGILGKVFDRFPMSIIPPEHVHIYFLAFASLAILATGCGCWSLSHLLISRIQTARFRRQQKKQDQAPDEER
jgi:hypothetical protein